MTEKMTIAALGGLTWFKRSRGNTELLLYIVLEHTGSKGANVASCANGVV